MAKQPFLSFISVTICVSSCVRRLFSEALRILTKLGAAGRLVLILCSLFTHNPGLHQCSGDGKDKMPIGEQFPYSPSESQSGRSILDLQSTVDDDCKSLVPDSRSVTDSDHDSSLPNLLYMLETDTQSEAGHSMPDLQSISDSDSECALSSVSNCDQEDTVSSIDCIPDLLYISEIDTQSEAGHSMPDLQSVSDSDCERSISDLQSVLSGDYDDSIPGLLSITDSDSEFSLSLVSNCDQERTISSIDCIPKHNYITNWLPTSCPTIFVSAHPMVGGGDDPSCAGSTSSPPTRSSTSDDSDSDTSHISFNREAWIACGKVWEDNMPKEVSRARSAARRIPDGVSAALIPNPSTAVTELLSHRINPEYSSIETASYSSDLPNTFVGDSDGLVFQNDLQECRTQLLASSSHVPYLRTKFNDAWLSGAQSIRLPGDPLTRYPLWVEHLLGNLEVSARKERAWMKASDWLFAVASCAANSDTTDMVADCFESFNEVPWDSIVPELGQAVLLTTKDLAAFLSDDWLNDEMMNAGIDFITHRLGHESRTRVVNVLFLEGLRAVRSRHGTYTTRQRHLLDQLIADDSVDTLYLPVHVNRNHWTLLRLDLISRQYAYGDSLCTSASVPHGVLDIIVWWLDSVQPGNNESAFTLSSQPLNIPRQTDGFSCGIIVLSKIAAALLEFTPWTQDSYACQRMEWYLRLSDNLRSHTVSLLCCLTNHPLIFLLHSNPVTTWFVMIAITRHIAGPAAYLQSRFRLMARTSCN